MVPNVENSFFVENLCFVFLCEKLENLENSLSCGKFGKIWKILCGKLFCAENFGKFGKMENLENLCFVFYVENWKIWKIVCVENSENGKIWKIFM